MAVALVMKFMIVHMRWLLILKPALFRNPVLQVLVLIEESSLTFWNMKLATAFFSIWGVLSQLSPLLANSIRNFLAGTKLIQLFPHLAVVRTALPKGMRIPFKLLLPSWPLGRVTCRVMHRRMLI